jgi:hypothetical protein
VAKKIVESGVLGKIQMAPLGGGGQTDGGLDFSSEPLVFRVSVATY